MAIITVSRGTYSGGKAVAEGVAARLGYDCVSREIVLEATADFGVPEEKLSRFLTRPPRFWGQRPGKLISHINLVRAALLKRGVSGDLVYHGYAGHLLLRGVSHVVRVRVIAGLERRIEAAMERCQLDREAARREIEHLDRQRTAWTRVLYGVSWQDSQLYDIVLNLDHVSVTAAVETVVLLSLQPEFQPSHDSRRIYRDLLLGSRVWGALSVDPRTQAANLRVVAVEGEVVITGHAPSRDALGAIHEVAAAVSGVSNVVVQVGIGGHWHW